MAGGRCGLAVDVILVANGGREAWARKLGVGRRLLDGKVVVVD